MDANSLFEMLAEIHNNSTAAGGDGPSLNKIDVRIPTGEIDENLGQEEYQDLKGFLLEEDPYSRPQLYLY